MAHDIHKDIEGDEKLEAMHEVGRRAAWWCVLCRAVLCCEVLRAGCTPHARACAAAHSTHHHPPPPTHTAHCAHAPPHPPGVGAL
jgi:hypothetical protein